jgi:nitrate reductase gamma subunit
MENTNTAISGEQETIPARAVTDSSKRIIIIASISGVVIIAALIAAIIFLFRAPLDTTAHIRDIFIIFMALESLVLGLVLITLVFQIARLTNLLQNEIKPILQSTNETISTLRGTTTFLSDNLVEPVIKLNEYLAALQQFLQLFKLSGKRK